jgi:hypothetical protein
MDDARRQWSSLHAEKINESYVGRVLRLTLLAPDIVETIMGGRQPVEMTLAVFMRELPARRPAVIAVFGAPASRRELCSQKDWLALHS